MSALVSVRGLGRDFGGVAALHDITVDVDAGARHAVIGPNGAGKTTLVNLIAGALRPSRGSIVFAGVDITRLSAAARARHGIGRTFQHPAVFARLTVAANLALAARRDRALRSRLVDDAGLAAHAATAAGRLPYGMQRSLELVMALAGRPRLLLLDEPSAGLDPDEITRLVGLIAALTTDTTVLLVDHNLDLVWSVADTVTVLHHGRHLATGSPDRVRADPQVRDAYLTTGHRQQALRQSTLDRPALLRVRALRAGYAGAPVINGLDLDVGVGEAVAVLGRNGTGKTTLLNAIAGLLPARSGHLQLAGSPLPHRPHQRARAGLAVVPQGRRLFGPLTVAEHLTCAHAAHRRSPRTPTGPVWTVTRVLDLLPALSQRLRHPARRLSGGEQQMLALARALLTNPRLLILDEPSEGLAPAVIAQLTTTLATLVDEGLAVLIAEQNLALATAVSHRLLVLDRGRIALTCPIGDIAADTHQRQLRLLLGVADSTPTRVDTDRSSTGSAEQARP